MWFSCFYGIYSYFIPYLKDFVLVFQIYHKTSCVILHLEEFSIMLNLFSNLFLKTPSIEGWLDGRPCLICSNWKSFNMCMIGWSLWVIHLILIVFFNWYYNWYLFCIFIFVSIYACLNFKQYQFRLVFTYIYMLSLIHIWRCRRSTLCRSRWSPYH